MACILKAPSESGKGVVVFTTQERDHLIKPEPVMRDKIGELKGRWVVGLHHNWHDHQFAYDDLFDFSMAGEGDLVERSGRDFPLITLDACNFVPAVFAEQRGDRFWDVLYVARPVFFKGFPEFFTSVRQLYDAGQRLRVLCICPMPPYRKEDEATTLYDVRELYEEVFGAGERRSFTLLTLDFDYPFPLDLETLAHFYRSSKVFVHFAPGERRCRVAAYAWVTGIPVVAMESVGSLLPAELRRPPLFYEAESYHSFPDRIVEAVNGSGGSLAAARSHFLETDTRAELRRQLDERFPDAGLGSGDGYALTELGTRLGRHHGLAPGPNQVPALLTSFVDLLTDEDGVQAAVERSEDPESALAGGLATQENSVRGLRSRRGPLRGIARLVGRQR
jgi:glycosyltransferase involved in cell wall biosynthesis